MDSSASNLYEPRDAPHPGELVAEYLEFNGWSQSDLARRSGLTPKTISEICNGKGPITPATALAFENGFQRPVHFWLNLQARYDEAVVRRRAGTRSAQWLEWASRFPLAEMRRLKYLDEKPAQNTVDELLAFLGVSSPDSWNAVWQSSNVAYRQTRRFKTDIEAIAVWVRETEISAASVNTAPYDERRLRASLDELRRLTLVRANKIMEPATAICAAAGVALVWVPALRHTGISGCARWLSNSKALIGLSLRYKTDDHLWFTFFHEVGHILEHRKQHAFVLDNDDNLVDGAVDPEMQRYEEEANRFARDALIPPDRLSKFLRAEDFGNEAIKAFADQIGVSPGIVVGRLQHDGVLKQFQGNTLKQRVEFGIAADE